MRDIGGDPSTPQSLHTQITMFARPKSKPSLLPLSNKRKRVPAIEEITFDPHSREDYLTGFHKRKLQRIKHAKDEAIKREREERLTARKIVGVEPCDTGHTC